MKTKSTIKSQSILVLICITNIYVAIYFAIIVCSSISFGAKANIENEINSLSVKSMNSIDLSSRGKQNIDQISREFPGDFSMLNNPE